MSNRKKGLKRRVWIRRNVDLRQYGFTDACLGCEAAAKGLKAVGHTEACRSRIEAKMLEDEASAARLWRARERTRERNGDTRNVESLARTRKAVKTACAASASIKHQTRGDKRHCKGRDRRVRRPRQTK